MGKFKVRLGVENARSFPRRKVVVKTRAEGGKKVFFFVVASSGGWSWWSLRGKTTTEDTCFARCSSGGKLHFSRVALFLRVFFCCCCFLAKSSVRGSEI